MQIGERAQQDVQRVELISLPVVLALPLVVFGGLRAAALPLVIAMSGIAGAFPALFCFGHVTGISVYAIQVTTMLGLGLAFMTGGVSPIPILQIGPGPTLAVLIDATVVRMLLVPATMALLGRRAWWAQTVLRRAHDRFGLREEAVPERELARM